ncbi:MAG: tRNA pseudouridine(38-40) synthase TruA [Candidatus Babeliales bacterium]
MLKYRSVIAYDGTDYLGWQIQGARKTVAYVLESAFLRVFKKKIHLRAASRTDAGVHAFGQVVTFYLDDFLDPEKIRWAWNNALPLSITVRSIEVARSDFSVYSPCVKEYHYQLFLRRPQPFLARYGWFIRQTVDLQRLREALRLFEGTYDFTCFSTDDTRKDRVRTIHAINFDYDNRYDWYTIVIQGPKFLRHMIRRIVGAAVIVACRKIVPLKVIEKALLTQKLENALLSAPSHGLLLKAIVYDEEAT